MSHPFQVDKCALLKSTYTFIKVKTKYNIQCIRQDPIQANTVKLNGGAPSCRFMVQANVRDKFFFLHFYLRSTLKASKMILRKKTGSRHFCFFFFVCVFSSILQIFPQSSLGLPDNHRRKIKESMELSKITMTTGLRRDRWWTHFKIGRCAPAGRGGLL